MINITVIGLWHQGVVACACLADKGYNVIGLDFEKKKIDSLNSSNSPIFEPGLNKLISKSIKKKKLKFCHEVNKQIKKSSILFISHDVPVNEKDLSDISVIFKDLNKIYKYLNDNVILYVTAQVPVGTCKKISNFIRKKRPKLNFEIAYSPENLRLGQAIQRFNKPELPVIGCRNLKIFKKLIRLFDSNINWHQCNLETAEMVKHALNSYLGMTIAFANELGNICNKIGANGHIVSKLLKLEPRIGSKAMLRPGMGFAGGTLARDIQTLKLVAAKNKINVPLINKILISNNNQNKNIVRIICDYFKNNFNKKICILGLTYKPNTSTLRRSISLQICKDLINKGFEVFANDPKADKKELIKLKKINFVDNIYSALKNADALILLTPWQNYSKLNFKRISKLMRGKLIFDTANMWKKDHILSNGFYYLNIGG